MAKPGHERLKTRYLDAERVRSYVGRSPQRHRAEMKVLGRGLDRLGGGLTFLDVPAGNGRVSRFLEDRGHRVVSADVSAPMLLGGEPRATLAVVADAMTLPFEDGAFDATLCFRFIYHLEGAALRARLLAELARVTRGHVLLSIRHPTSLHAVTRRLKSALRGRFRDQRATTVGRIAREAALQGLVLQDADAEAAYRKEFWLVTLSRRRPV